MSLLVPYEAQQMLDTKIATAQSSQQLRRPKRQNTSFFFPRRTYGSTASPSTPRPMTVLAISKKIVALPAVTGPLRPIRPSQAPFVAKNNPPVDRTQRTMSTNKTFVFDRLYLANETHPWLTTYAITISVFKDLSKKYQITDAQPYQRQRLRTSSDLGTSRTQQDTYKSVIPPKNNVAGAANAVPLEPLHGRRDKATYKDK